jgi:hypothetical protein
MISEHPDDIILLDYVEGMLQGQASDSVRRHIATCRACRRTLAELSDTVSELERLPTAEIPHDALGRPGRAGMLRALARFVPVVLAATALVCAILFTRSGAGRKHDDSAAAATGAPTRPLVLPATLTRRALHYKLSQSPYRLANVIVTKVPWVGGFALMVPRDKLDETKTAIRDIASQMHLANGSTCDRVVPGMCDGVQITGVRVPSDAAEQADAVGATS